MADFHTQLADQLVGAASKKRRMRFARSHLPQLDGLLTTLAVVAALAIGVGMLISVTATPTEEARPANTDAILNAPLERVDGSGTLRLADLRGRPTLVSWTASWCEPCRANEASLALAAGRGLNVVVIAYHDSTAAAKALGETLTTATVVTDESDRLFDSLPLSGVPATRALDAAGQIVESWDGPITTTDVEDLATQQPAP